MKRLKILILIFCLALSVPLAYFVLRTYQGLEQEEVATLRFFGDTLFDEMEQTLTAIVLTEEGRAIDEYNFSIISPGHQRESGKSDRSPISFRPKEDFILGYFQNNPDGSFQSPLIDTTKPGPVKNEVILAQLEDANRIFNRRRVEVTDKPKAKPKLPVVLAKTEEKRSKGFAEKYLDFSRSQRETGRLGQKDKRLEQITVSQARNIVKQDQQKTARRQAPPAPSAARSQSFLGASKEGLADVDTLKKQRASEPVLAESEESAQAAAPADADEVQDFQVEVAPLQAVFINDDQIFIFRRIMINNQIYRQGFILQVKAFLDHMVKSFFITQPMADFTSLRLQVMDQGREAKSVQAGVQSSNPQFILNRAFPSPFAFLHGTLACDQIPKAAGRDTLSVMLIVLAVIMLMGLLAIYKSTGTIVDLSERRSQFVSSVTHELKTPLTNIRMYVEMLEQGIATDRQREEEYFRILDSEGARLSRLINNVLELSKLEKSQRHIDMQTGTFEDVIQAVETVMRVKLKQEGFSLNVEWGRIEPFQYDREVMIQVLINLIENSIKFGKSETTRQITIRTGYDNGCMNISVADTGPGIPRHALKKIFEDFYRVDNSLTRTTRGTGIGLALVKKFITLMGGNVTAANNDGPGSTITISL
jgi:signal transduction histidine kinase